MFSILKQRTIAIYHILTTRKPHLGAFIFISILFLGGYLLAGVYASNTGHLSVLSPQIANAAPADPPATPKPATDAGAGQNSSTDGVGYFMTAVIKLLLYGASLMLKLAIFCLAFIIQIAGYNGYLNSTAVNIGWVMVRDITNMFFVIILLLVAFGTILGLEQYEWKKMLVKFFFAAVLVNFSRIICGVIIDVGQVVMITFVNGIAATAGGNLINAFSMDQIMGLSANADSAAISNTGQIFTAALGAIIFSSIILAMMLVFVFMLLSRMIVLWILIVLSPFAFVLSVIPQTQKYASQWWSEFGNHVVVGPAVVFFLWLSFAVVGGGKINDEIAANSAVPNKTNGGQDAAGISGAMDWNSMSSFAIAIGILLVGAKTSQSLGTVGGSAMSKATDFGKKVAMVASGAAVGMWAGSKVKQGAVGAARLAGKGLYAATLSNTVAQTKMWGERQLEGYRSWRAGGPKPKMKVDAKGNEVQERDANGALVFEDEDQRKGGLLTTYLKGRQESLLKSEKLLEKVKNQRTVREDLVKTRAGAMPTYLFQKMEGANIHDLDRMEQGQLEAEKERSAAKTSQFKAEGRALILSADRFKAGKWESKDKMGDKYKGTMAEQVTTHKEKASAVEAQIKSLFAVATTSNGNVKKAINAKIKAEMKAEVDVKQADLQSGGMKLHYLQAGGAALLARKTEIEAREKEEHAVIEAVQKGAASTFAKTHPSAKHIFDTQKEAELKSKVFAGDIAEAESDAEMRVKSLDTGKDLVSQINLSEQAKKAADDFIKILKDEDLKIQFNKAGEAIAEAAKNGPAALDKLAEDDIYVRAMKMSKKSAHEGEVLGIVQKEAESMAEGEYVDKGIRGFATPSAAFVSVAKKTSDDLNSLNNAALGKALTDNMFFIADDEGTGENGNSDISKRAALYGTISKVNSECYIDDTMGIMAAELSDLYNEEFVAKMQKENPEQLAKMQKRKAIFVDRLGMLSEETDKDGKKYIKGTSNSKSSAIMQNYAVTGGNLDLMDKHAQVEQTMISAKKNGVDLSYADAMTSTLGEDGAKAFAGQMRKYDTLLKDATSSFKNGALAGGHIQLGGHQKFDEKLGFHRMSTNAEAADIMESEVRKRGSKAGYQMHSVGDLNTGTNVLEKVDARAYGNTIGKVTSHLEAKNIQDRTVDVLMGYRPSETKQMDGEHGVLGGSEAGIIEKFGSIENFLKEVVVPQLAAGPQAFALMAQRKFGNVDKVGAENGALKLQIGDKIVANSLSDLITQVQDLLGNQVGDMAEALEASKKQAEALQKNIGRAAKSNKKEGDSDEVS